MGLSGFPLILGKMQVPPLGGGVRFWGPVGGSLSLVDRQCMGMLPLCSDLFCFAGFHFSLCRVLEQSASGTVSGPVDMAQVNQKRGVSLNPVVHSFSTCYGVVNLNLLHPELLCDPPPPSPQGIRQVGGWV